MLARLSIENILLLKRVAIDFSAGLNVLTGETGAGKSILLDALGLVLGERSEAGLVRKGAASATVIAEFETEAAGALTEFYDTHGIEHDTQLTLRRVLQADGKSRAFVNDTPVAVATLKKLGELLIARHGQHDQRGLLDSKQHRTLLDQFGGHGKLLIATKTAFERFKAADTELQQLLARAQEAAREEAWLRQTAEELGALDPQEGEEDKLLALRKQANDAKAATGAIEQALALLTEENGAALQLRQVGKLMAKISGLDESATQALERAESDVEEISVALETLLSAAHLDPMALERAEDRLHALRGAARKFNVAVALLPSLYAESAQKLQTLTNLDAERKRAEQALAAAEQAYQNAAQQLHDARAKAAEKLTKAVASELKPLKMGSTQLRVVQTPLPPQSWGMGGMHQVSFEVATNAGMPFGPLAKVASGGELSRLLLAMKVVLRDAENATAIFDEIDSGTGGAVAEAIGLRLKKLAGDAQVIVVTHLPQVAALANHHLYITKSGGKDVSTSVATLDATQRAEELARMLSGATISDEARKAAHKLLEAAS